MHKLLASQIKRHLTELKEIPAEWEKFIEAVSLAYKEFNDDYELMERAMNISSEELMEKNSSLLEEISKREQIEDELKNINLVINSYLKVKILKKLKMKNLIF